LHGRARLVKDAAVTRTGQVRVPAARWVFAAMAVAVRSPEGRQTSLFLWRRQNPDTDLSDELSS
jgi:hypothetical protein